MHSTVPTSDRRLTMQQLLHQVCYPGPGTICWSLILCASNLGRLVRPLFLLILLTVPSRLGRRRSRCPRQHRLNNDVSSPSCVSWRGKR
ncbi:hypothetical protein CORC01_00344 [Colletotrichum orchidophilum]|uniref:Uncharacterized protein n=1 Tax=Colletotrichum orchidophilum TaxID=1209926 RepID=A0A1G4BSS4_9PEZI|nr:uncharacterized protein CORC01_00344 [Colletotrichum orchidophilum]OHF04492.1 hypothetical protein CORC01_00344 [Colletotrichum orchidophilum]